MLIFHANAFDLPKLRRLAARVLSGNRAVTSPRPRRPRYRPSGLSNNPILVAWDRLLYRLRDSRSIGYAVTGLVLLAMLGYSWRLWNVTQSGQQTIWVEFAHNGEAISALQDDDPVVMSGVLVGRVHHIEPQGDGARLLLEFFSYQKIRSDAHAINFPQGLMGQRVVVVDRGSVDSALIPDGSTIPGVFQPGIAETMSQIEVLVSRVNAIHDAADGWIVGDSLHKPAYQRIQQTFQDVNSLVGMMNSIADLSEGAGQKLSDVDGGLRVIKDGLRTSEQDLDAIYAKTDIMLDTAGTFVHSLRPMVTQARTMEAALWDTSSMVVRQLHDDSLYRKLVVMNQDLQKVGAVLSGEVSIGFNFGFWRSLRFFRPER
jgi:ABC-type transporter Mla subunit MlaD